MAFIDKTGLQHLWGHTVERLNEKADIKVVETLATRVPEVSAAHQQLITDGEGNAQWEERTHWAEARNIVLFDNVELINEDEIDNPTNFEIRVPFAEYPYQDSQGYPMPWQIGDICTVIFDNTTYTCSVKEANGMLGIGNLQLFFGDAIEATEEPFGIISLPPEAPYIPVITSYTPSSRYLTIIRESVIVHKLDNKYLPDEAFYTHPTYTALTGLPTSASINLSFGGAFAVSQVKTDSMGHVLSLTSKTIQMPKAIATTTYSGLMSAADKTKLDGLGASDWNQNDETAVDYIKNRTHWEEIGEPTTWVDNVTLDMTNTGSLYNSFTLPKQLTLGDEYTVIFNGTEYKCIAYTVPGPNTPGIGSTSFIGNSNGGGNGEPFLLFSFSEGQSINFYANSGATYTLTIKDSGNIVHKIPDKYLPSLSEMGAAAANHTHSVGSLTGGTFYAQVSIGSSYQPPSASILRNSKLVTTETNPSYNGEIYWTYE